MIELFQIINMRNTLLKKSLLRDKFICLTMKGILIPFLIAYLTIILKNIIWWYSIFNKKDGKNGYYKR